MPEEKDPDALIAAQTALLIAEMEAILQRTRVLVLDRNAPVVMAKEKPEEA